MNEMSRLKSTLKEQNHRLIVVSQEKIRLEAKNKTNPSTETTETQDRTQLSVSNKKLTLKSLQDKINDLNSQVRLYFKALKLVAKGKILRNYKSNYLLYVWDISIPYFEFCF